MLGINSRWSRSIGILGLVLLWLCFTTIFIPSRKKSVSSMKKIAVTVTVEEYSEDVDVVTTYDEIVNRSTFPTTLPPVMFVTSKDREEFFASKTSTVATKSTNNLLIVEAKADHISTTTQEDTSPSGSYNVTMEESSHIYAIDSSTATNNASSTTTTGNVAPVPLDTIELVVINSTSSGAFPEELQQTTTKNNETFESTPITSQPNGGLIVLTVDNFTNTDNNKYTNNQMQPKAGEAVQEDYYYEYEHMPGTTQEPLDLSEYKKVYPRYKDPIPEEYVKTMAY